MPRLAIALLFVSTTAAAQPAGNLALDPFHPAMDARGYLTVDASELLGDKELSFGLGSLEWGHHLLGMSSGQAYYSVDNMVSATLVGAVGIKVGIPLEFGASLPLAIMSGDRGPDLVDPTNPNNTKNYRVDGQGLGNVGFHVKTRFARVGGVGFAAIASIYLPTATKDHFLGDSGYTPQLTGVIDRSFGDRFRLAINAGVRLRSTQTFTDAGFMGAPATMATITTSADAPLGIAAAWAVSPNKFEVIGEVFGAAPLGPHQGYQPLEALGGLKVYLAKNSYMSLGAGRGLLPGQGGNPDFRGFIGIVFEPSMGDRNRVRIEDDNTVATEPPPPPPSDRDRLDDNEEPCDVETKIICPDRPMVVDQGSVLVTLQPIEFEFDKAIIRPSSYHIVDAVAKALVDNPDIKLVEVQGHTDERGSADYNMDLSRRRAAAVVTYLVEHGIAADRLHSNGYGLTMPVDRGHNEAAWEKNRRVEFVIEKRD
jgi:outer membrane protein OmpA-like peptidoglycan-associated protein